MNLVRVGITEEPAYDLDRRCRARIARYAPQEGGLDNFLLLGGMACQYLAYLEHGCDKEIP